MDEEDDFDQAIRLLQLLATIIVNATNLFPAERIPRVYPALAEMDRPFNRTFYSNVNPRLFRESFRVDRSVFDQLFEECRDAIADELRSKREVLAVTLDWLETSSSVRAQETRFHISFATCHKYCLAGIQAIILSLRKLVPLSFAHRFPHFHQALCAIDGAHFQVQVAKTDADRFRSRKGITTTNVLMASDWDLNVAFVYAGVEGSAHDSTVLGFSGFIPKLPRNYYVLADAGYALTTQVLTPYRSTRYHLREWASAQERPQNARELFNLRHSSARMQSKECLVY